MRIQKVHCPHCNESVEFKRTKTGGWVAVGGAAGAGIGYGIAAGLGLAGAIAGAPVAIPAALVGAAVLGAIGSFAGDKVAGNKAKCPECSKLIRF